MATKRIHRQDRGRPPLSSRLLFIKQGVGVFVGALIFLSSMVQMPYNDWLYQHLPFWMASACIIIFAVCFVTLSIPNKSRRTLWLLTIGGIAAALMIKPCICMAPVTWYITLPLTIIAYFFVKRQFPKESDSDEENTFFGRFFDRPLSESDTTDDSVGRQVRNDKMDKSKGSKE